MLELWPQKAKARHANVKFAPFLFSAQWAKIIKNNIKYNKKQKNNKKK
jgi:hypothetical protein